MSVLFLFEAFLQSRLAEAYEQHSEPIIALEEPEAHLHPSAVCALWPVLDQLPGQKIIATHSGDLLSSVPLSAIRRLARKNNNVEVFRLNETTLDPRESAQVAFHVKAKRGSLLFARCWLFVEGESEFSIIPELARLLGYELECESVSCFDFSQCALEALIKVADDLGIAWHLLSDGDTSGLDYAKTATSLLAGRVQGAHITTIPEQNLERYFWAAGYDYVYERSVLNRHRHMVTAAKGTPSYITQTIKAAKTSVGSKPLLALTVLDEVRKLGSAGVPPMLKAAIARSVDLARASA